MRLVDRLWHLMQWPCILCGFGVHRIHRHFVSNYPPISKKIAAIRIKAKFFNISLICVQALKMIRMKKLKMLSMRPSKTHMIAVRHMMWKLKIVLGDLDGMHRQPYHRTFQPLARDQRKWNKADWFRNGSSAVPNLNTVKFIRLLGWILIEKLKIKLIFLWSMDGTLSVS